MGALLIGYPRVSTDEQDLTAQQDALAALGVHRIYLDHGLTAPTATDPACARPSRPAAAATPSSSRNSTGSPGPCRMPARSPTAHRPPGPAQPRRSGVRPDRRGRTAVVQGTCDGRRVRSRPDQHAHQGRDEGRQSTRTAAWEEAQAHSTPEAHLVSLHATGDYTTGELGELFRVARSTVYRTLDRARTDRTPALSAQHHHRAPA